MGQVPVLHTAEGEMNQSNSMARYVAKKFGEFSNAGDERNDGRF